MTRRRSHRLTQRDEELLPRPQARQAEHPFWAYRRIWVHLRFVEQVSVNRRWSLRPLREHCLRPPISA
jgi:hypothetical protein